MIYEIKRFEYSDELTCDNNMFIDSQLFIDTKKIFSIEEFNNGKIYGFRINGITYPLLDSEDFSFLVLKQNPQFTSVYDKYEYYHKDYSRLSEQEKKDYTEYEKLEIKASNLIYDHYSEIFKEIVELMKSEQ